MRGALNHCYSWGTAAAMIASVVVLPSCGGPPREEALYKWSELNCLSLAYAFQKFRKDRGAFPVSFGDVFPSYVNASDLVSGRIILDGPSPRGLIDDHPEFVDYLSDYGFLTKDSVVLIFENPRLWQRTHEVAYAEVDANGEVASRGRIELPLFFRYIEAKGYVDKDRERSESDLN